MKKAFPTMLTTVVAILMFSVATSPVMATTVTHAMYAGSPHYYTPWWWENKMKVGEVWIWNDGDYLYVKYITTYFGDWELTETHLAVAEYFADIPQTKSGNPKVGNFPYKMMHDPPVTEYTYMIPLTWAPGTILYIAAHAIVQKPMGCGVYQEETAWADCGGPNAYFQGNNWATYFTYTVQ